MIFVTTEGKSIDTETDLTSAERHILQKLFFWEALASSPEEFRKKTDEALLKGWNNSGPIEESAAFRSIIGELERRLSRRLASENSGNVVLF